MTDSIKNLFNSSVMTSEKANGLLNKGTLDDADVQLILNSDLSKLSPDTLEKLRTAAMTVQASLGVGNGNSPSGTGPALSAPSADLNLASITDLSNILGLLDNKTQALNNKVSLDLIKSNSAVRKNNLDEAMKKLNEQIEKAKEQEKLGFWQKLLGGISKAFGFIAAAVTLAVGVVSGNPLMIVGGIAMLYTQIDSVIAENNDGKGLIAMALIGMGASEEFAKDFNNYFDMAVTVVAGVVCAVACPGSLSDSVKAVTSVINGITGIGSSATSVANGGVTIAKGDVDSDLVKLQSSVTKIQAKKVWIDMFQQALIDNLKHNIEVNQQMVEKVKNIVEGNKETTEAIITGSPNNA